MNTDDTWTWIAVVTALGCGLLAGVWFAFSGFVMTALDRLPPSGSVAAMQSINRFAPKAPLMIPLLGTAALCLWLGVWAVRSWGDRRAAWTLAGCAAYLVGSIGVTSAANVPLNDRLERVSAQGASAAHEWDRYMSAWTAWNHVRGVLTLAAAALLTVAVAKA